MMYYERSETLIPDLLPPEERLSDAARSRSLSFESEYFSSRHGRNFERSSPDSELLDIPDVSFNNVSLSGHVPWYRRLFGSSQVARNSSWLVPERPDVPLLSPVISAPDPSGTHLFDRCLVASHGSECAENPASKQQGIRQLACAASICLLFMVGQAVGGYLANSLAIMTDAAHMLSDFASFIVSLFALWISQKSASSKMSFGYHRAEVLGALFSVLVIWIITGVLVYMAIDRIVDQDYSIDSDTMIVVAALGVIMNLAMGFVLGGNCCGKLCQFQHRHSHGGSSHSHDHHSHGDDDPTGDSAPKDMNVRAALIHVLGDLIQSVGVLIAAYVIKYEPSWKIADPICTFFFSGLVLMTTYGLVKECGQILMEGVPPSFPEVAVRTYLLSIPGVVGLHSLNIWSLTPEKTMLSVHLTIDSSGSHDEILAVVIRTLKEDFKLFHVTVQIEKNSIEDA